MMVVIACLYSWQAVMEQVVIKSYGYCEKTGTIQDSSIIAPIVTILVSWISS